MLAVQVAVLECPHDCVFHSVQGVVQALGRAFVCFSHSIWLSGRKKLVSQCMCVYNRTWMKLPRGAE